MRRSWFVFVFVSVLPLLAAPSAASDSVGLVDTTQGRWHLFD